MIQSCGTLVYWREFQTLIPRHPQNPSTLGLVSCRQIHNCLIPMLYQREWVTQSMLWCEPHCKPCLLRRPMLSTHCPVNGTKEAVPCTGTPQGTYGQFLTSCMFVSIFPPFKHVFLQPHVWILNNAHQVKSMYYI